MKAVRFVDESDVTEPIFQTVRESGSPVNLLVGSKKFVEGLDCWRVSTLGLMNVFGIEADFMQRFRDYLKSQGTVSIQPVTLNDSEFRFVCDLDDYVRAHKDEFVAQGR